MADIKFRITVGRLLCKHLRDMLESEVFEGRKIRWREGKGWIEREFSVIGDAADINAVAERIDYWVKAMGK